MEVNETNKRGKGEGEEERKERPGRTSKDFLVHRFKYYATSSLVRMQSGVSDEALS